MARLKVFVFDHIAADGASLRPRPQSLAHQGDLLLRALLADLGALDDVELVTAAGSGAATAATAPHMAASHATSAQEHDGEGQAQPGSAPDAPRASHREARQRTWPDTQQALHRETRQRTRPDTQQASHREARQRMRPAPRDGGTPAAPMRAQPAQAGRSMAAPSLDAAAAGAPALQDGASRALPEAQARLAAGLQAADAVWPLVSGSESVLECLSRSILRGNRILLGSAPGAVEVAASKLRLARVLAEGGVEAVATYSPHAALPQDGGPWVVKPDDGAGCLDTRLFSDRAAALAWIRASAHGEYVLQPFVAGKLGSLSLICCDGAARLLACNQERVAMRDNRFHFLGSVVNGLADNDGTLARLAQQVAAAIPSLWGYVGVDFVLTAQGAVVLDVNPRLTAAYAGLHASIGCNPAGLVLDLLKDPAALPGPVGVRRAVSVDVGMS